MGLGLFIYLFLFFEGDRQYKYISLGNPAKDEFNGNAPQEALSPFPAEGWTGIKASPPSPLEFLLGIDAHTQLLRCVACSQMTI